MLVNRVHKPHICRICGNGIGIKVCKCQRAFYCSKNCQKIDWKDHKSDCYKIIDPPKARFANSSSISPVKCASESSQQQIYAPSQTAQLSRERKQYDPTPLQYQHNSLDTHTTAATKIEDFEENLLNSLLHSVNESTEREILNSLNITDELLKSYNLDTDSTSSYDELNSQKYQPTDQPFDGKFFEQIQESYEYIPEYKETRDILEKELTLFREINLHEPQQQLGEEKDLHVASDIMQISSNNPKFINHAKLDDHLLYK